MYFCLNLLYFCVLFNLTSVALVHFVVYINHFLGYPDLWSEVTFYFPQDTEK